MALIARDIDHHMREIGPWVDFSRTCDTFKAGDPDTPVQGIAVAWMSTLKNLKEAHRMGCNLFITHEPTFYSHMDDDPVFDEDECVREKRAFLQQTGMVVYRCHDVWDRVPQHGILDTWAWFLELADEPVADETFMRVVPIEPTSLRRLAEHVGCRTSMFGQETVLTIGDPEQQVTRVGIGTGAIASAREYHRMGADVGIVTELLWWRDARWAMDMEFPVLVVDHTVSEEPGMMSLAVYLTQVFPGVPVKHIATGCPYGVVSVAED